MRSGWLLALLLAGLAAMPGPVQAAEGILVWRLQAKTGVSESDIDSLSGYLAAEVERHSGARITSQADIETILEGEQQKIKCGAGSSDACLAEIGGALGVPEAVSGDLGHVGDIWILNLRRVDVRHASSIKRVSRQTKGAITSMVEELPYVVAELFGKELPRPVVGPAGQGQGQPVAPVPPTTETPSLGPGPWRIAAYSSIGAGAAFLILGGISTWQMGKAWDDAQHGNLSAEDRHATWKAMTITGYAVGGAAVIAGAVIFFLDPDGKGEQPANVSVTPWNDGAYLLVGGKF